MSGFERRLCKGSAVLVAFGGFILLLQAYAAFRAGRWLFLFPGDGRSMTPAQAAILALLFIALGSIGARQMWKDKPDKGADK